MSMNVLLIAKQSFKEIYQSKVLMNILFLGVLLLLLTFVVSEFSYGVAEKVTLDIGLGLISLSGVAISLFLGSRLIVNEVENRTLYMVLVRPVARYEFLLGKVIGLAAIVFLNLIALFSLLLVLYFALGGSWDDMIGWTLFFVYMESLLVLVMSLFFSLFSNPIISIMVTLTMFIAGHGVETVKETHLYQKDDLLRGFVDFYTQWLPNFDKLNLKNYVLYNKFLPNDWFLVASGYSFTWVFVFIVFAIVLFNKKELT